MDLNIFTCFKQLVKSTGSILYNLMCVQFCRIHKKQHKINNTHVVVDPNHKHIIKCGKQDRLVHFIETNEKNNNKKKNPKTQNVPLIVVEGLQYAFYNLQLLLRPFLTIVPGDGNCLIGAYILAVRDPAINNDNCWLDRLQTLRREAIDFVRHQINYGIVDWETLVDSYPKIANWDNEYIKLKLPGAGDDADTMPQVISSYTGSKILIINLATNHTEFVLPEHIFNGTTTRKVPIVLVRNYDHYEALDVPIEEEERLVTLFNDAQAEKKTFCNIGLIVNPSWRIVTPSCHTFDLNRKSLKLYFWYTNDNEMLVKTKYILF